MSPYCKPPTIRHSNSLRPPGARSRPAVFTRRDYLMVATDRANDLKIRWVHSPHLCRTLAHRVVRVGRLLQTRPKVSGVVCHRNYCPGLLTHGSGHPSIGNYRYIQPQDSRLRLIRRRVSLASDPFRPSTYLEPCPGPRERPGNTKAGHLLARGTRSGEGWVTGNPFWEGVGIVAVWVPRINCSSLHYCGRLARRVGLCSCTVDSARPASRSHMSQGTFASASKRSGRPMPGRRNPGRYLHRARSIPAGGQRGPRWWTHKRRRRGRSSGSATDRKS